MKDYVAPPLPVFGDRVHMAGPYPFSGEVRGIVDGECWIVRSFRRRRQCWDYSCFLKLDWEFGIWRPGPVPKKVDGRWPWETPR